MRPVGLYHMCVNNEFRNSRKQTIKEYTIILECNKNLSYQEFTLYVIYFCYYVVLIVFNRQLRIDTQRHEETLASKMLH